MFRVGVFMGGLTTGSAADSRGLLSETSSASRLWVLGMPAGVALLREFGVVKIPIPTSSYMISQSRFSESLTLGSLVFGLELGVGFRTRIDNIGPYLLAVYVLLVAPRWGVITVLSLGWAIGRTFALAIRLIPRLRQREYLSERFGRSRYDSVLGKIGGVSARLTAVAGIVFAMTSGA